MWVKIILLFLFVGIVVSLGMALFSMMRDKGQGKKTVNALTARVILSIIVFFLLVLSYGMGWIQPHGIVPM